MLLGIALPHHFLQDLRGHCFVADLPVGLDQIELRLNIVPVRIALNRWRRGSTFSVVKVQIESAKVEFEIEPGARIRGGRRCSGRNVELG